MVFSSPLVLWALALTLVPIIIHLFRFRRHKTVFFSDISLLKEVQTASQAKNQLRHWLLLAARVLFVTLLVLAFAEPIIPSESKSESSDLIGIYVDNSFSMQSEGGTGTALQKAIQAAYEISSSYPRGTQFQLITNNFSAAEKRFVDQEAFLQALDDVSSTSIHCTLDEISSFHQQGLKGQLSTSSLYVISDFNEVLDSSLTSLDTSQRITFLPIQVDQVQNIAIDSAWVETPITRPGQEQQLSFTVHNYGDSPVTGLRLDVRSNSSSLGALVIDLPAGGVLDTNISIIPEQTGVLSGVIQIQDLPVTFDNDYYFSIPVTESVRIAEISGSKTEALNPFEKLFDSESYRFERMEQEQLLLDEIDRAQLIILNGVSEISSGLENAALDHLSSGRHALFVPPTHVSSALTERLDQSFGVRLGSLDTIERRVNKVNLDHFLYKGSFASGLENVDLPLSKQHYSISIPSGQISILDLFGGEPLVLSRFVASGQVFVITSPLEDEYTNLHKHALFVPMMINMASNSGVFTPLAFSTSTSRVAMGVTSERVELISETDSTRAIPGLTHDGLLLSELDLKPGIYRLASSDSVLASLAFNYDRHESLTEVPATSEIETFIADHQLNATLFESDLDTLSSTIATADIGEALWPYFVLAALILLIIETILLKLKRS